jgi:uncharacterized membrane protein (DUF485 family)
VDRARLEVSGFRSREGAILAREDEWVRLGKTSAFQELVRSKKAFILPATIFFMVFYFGLPVLTGFTTVLNGSAIGAISWAYVYAFAQFIMTWTLLHMYVSRANRWDALVDQARSQAADSGREG